MLSEYAIDIFLGIWTFIHMVVAIIHRFRQKTHQVAPVIDMTFNQLGPQQTQNRDMEEFFQPDSIIESSIKSFRHVTPKNSSPRDQRSIAAKSHFHDTTHDSDLNIQRRAQRSITNIQPRRLDNRRKTKLILPDGTITETYQIRRGNRVKSQIHTPSHSQLKPQHQRINTEGQIEEVLQQKKPQIYVSFLQKQEFHQIQFILNSKHHAQLLLFIAYQRQFVNIAIIGILMQFNLNWMLYPISAGIIILARIIDYTLYKYLRSFIKYWRVYYIIQFIAALVLIVLYIFQNNELDWLFVSLIGVILDQVTELIRSCFQPLYYKIKGN